MPNSKIRKNSIKFGGSAALAAAMIGAWLSLGGDRLAWVSELRAAELLHKTQHVELDDIMSRQMQLLSVVGADVLRLKIARFSDEITAREDRGMDVSPLLLEQRRIYQFELGQIQEQINAIMSGRGAP